MVTTEDFCEDWEAETRAMQDLNAEILADRVSEAAKQAVKQAVLDFYKRRF